MTAIMPASSGIPKAPSAGIAVVVADTAVVVVGATVELVVAAVVELVVATEELVVVEVVEVLLEGLPPSRSHVAVQVGAVCGSLDEVAVHATTALVVPPKV